MFHTEHSRVLLTSPSEWALHRRDAGECHNQLHPRSRLVSLLLKSIVTARLKRFNTCPVHRWQQIQPLFVLVAVIAATLLLLAACGEVCETQGGVYLVRPEAGASP
jgi:hypothetical protein